MFAANMASVTVNTTSAFGVVAAFLGPLVGVVVGAWGAWSVARAGDKTAQIRALTRALADYIAAASLVSVELGNAAQPNWYQRQLMHLPMFRPGSFLMEVLFRLMTGSRVDDRAREFQRARAEVVLLAPDDVVALVHAVDELFYAWQAKPGPEYWERWIDLKDKLRVEAQRAINERQGRRYRFRRSGRDPDSDAAFTPDRHPAPAAARGDA